MGLKSVGSVCCVTHIKEPNALDEKKRGSPRCSWLDWRHIAPQHLVNHYMVLTIRSHVPLTLQSILGALYPLEKGALKRLLLDLLFETLTKSTST